MSAPPVPARPSIATSAAPAAAPPTTPVPATGAAAAADDDDKENGCCDRCVTGTTSCVVGALAWADATFEYLVWKRKPVLLVWWTLMALYYLASGLMGANDWPRPSHYIAGKDFNSLTNTTEYMIPGCCYQSKTATLRDLQWCVSGNALPEFYGVRQTLSIWDSAFPLVAMCTFLYHITGLLYLSSDVLRDDAAARQKLRDVMMVVTSAVILPMYYLILANIMWAVVGPLNFFEKCTVPGSPLEPNVAGVRDRFDTFAINLALTAPDPVQSAVRLLSFFGFYVVYIVPRALLVGCGCARPKYSQSRDDPDAIAAAHGSGVGRAPCLWLAEIYNPAVRLMGRRILGPLLRVILPDAMVAAPNVVSPKGSVATTKSEVPLTSVAVASPSGAGDVKAQ